MPTGRGFTYPKKYTNAGSVEALQIANTVNWQYLEAYINNNLPFLTDGQWAFNDDLFIDNQVYFGTPSAWVGGIGRGSGQTDRVWLWAGQSTNPVTDAYPRIVLDQGDGIIYIQDTQIQAQEVGRSAVEIFPKGTLITMGANESNTDFSNVSAVEEQITDANTTVACDYAGQDVYVDFTIMATWINMSPDVTYIIRPTIGGSSASNVPFAFAFGTDTSASGSGGDGVDIDGTSGSESAHDHTVGGSSWATNAASGHSHTLPNTASSTTGTDAHSHSSGTFSVNGNHTHTLNADTVITFQSMTIREIHGTSANGSGNVVLGFSARGDGAADITAWSVTYAVWRQ